VVITGTPEGMMDYFEKVICILCHCQPTSIDTTGFEVNAGTHSLRTCALLAKPISS